MGQNEVEISHNERVRRRLQVVYARKTRERQTFMQELRQHRAKKDKTLIRNLKNSVGPRWYQSLSVIQRAMLDTLETCMYQDVLAGRPQKTIPVIRALGLIPTPKRSDIMTCIYLAKEDPREMIAQLYLHIFDTGIEGKREAYPLNARLLLSAIYYLGLDEMMRSLKKRFHPKPTEKPPIPKRRRPSKINLADPYLQKLAIPAPTKPTPKRLTPPPLPNVDELLESYEEEPPPVYRKPQPPPPPPPPKKRIPREVCDQLAGVPPDILRTDSLNSINKKASKDRRKGPNSDGQQEGKKVYGIGLNFRKKGGVRRVKLKPPVTGRENAQYTITGVAQRNGHSWFILSNVCTLPALGHLIHGGHAKMNNDFITINRGYTAFQPPPGPDPCNCLKQWQNSVMDYVKDSKCYCGHRYDFGNAGTFPPDELPFFVKPSRHIPFQMNFETVYNTDPKLLQIEKDVTQMWKTESLLQTGSTTQLKDDKKKKKKRTSNITLGLNTKPEDYVKYALHPMKYKNVAARLPDVHMAPELVDWMKRRLHGPYKPEEKAEYLHKSTTYWNFFQTLDFKGWGHVPPPTVPEFRTPTTWLNKQKLNNKFNSFTQKYKFDMYKSHAKIINLLWRTMYQPEFPDKQFRAIFYSYLMSQPGDLQLMNPYSAIKVNERKTILMNKRYICLPAGAENLQQ